MDGSKVLHATENDFDEIVRSGVAVVDFWAEWCQPCIMLGPAIEQLAEKYADRAKVVKVNVDECPALAGRFGIHGIPTLVIMKDGQEQERLIGLRPLQDIENTLSRYL